MAKHDLNEIFNERTFGVILPTILRAVVEFEKDDSMTDTEKLETLLKLFKYEFIETVETLKAFEYDNKRAEDGEE